MKKILIMCEGPNELKVVNLLLDHGVHGYVFADDVVRTDYQPRAGLEFVAVILRAAAEAGAGENDIAFAEGGVAQDGYAGDELVSGSDFGLA